MRITNFGTTALLFDDGIRQIMFDPHFTRPSGLKVVFGQLKTNEKIADDMIKAYKMDRLEAIFVSHSHYDHVMDVPYLAKKKNSSVYGSESVLNVARGGGVPEDKLHHFKPRDTVSVGEYTITVLQAKHAKASIFNNDFGETINEPICQPAKRKVYKEGGSVDYLVEHRGKTYLFHPSFACVEGQLDHIRADVMFMSIAGLWEVSKKTRKHIFEETIGKVKPKVVIPVHWDDFFRGLDRKVREVPSFRKNHKSIVEELKRYCAEKGIECKVLMPLESVVYGGETEK